MIRFVPIDKTGQQREKHRQVLLASRRAIQEALGPGSKVGPITSGGFEVLTEDPDAESTIAKAISEAAMAEPTAPGLVMTAQGALLPDVEPEDV